jgi:glycosyltransferase involved in cell wall biosynthesis
MKRILHLAPQNYAGVPYDFYKMHIACGDESHLITFHQNVRDFSEDICLNFPLPDFKLAKFWRKKKVGDREMTPRKGTPVFKANNLIEEYYFRLNDYLRKPVVEKIIREYLLDTYDIIHYDAGLDFYRNASQAKKWKKAGKKIVCCYYGSDLRIRGVIPELHNIADLNITSEFDHLQMMDGLEYVFYPYNPLELPPRKAHEHKAVRIVHSPTNRRYKGTELILEVIKKIQGEKFIDFRLLENMPRHEVLQIKSTCDICIDQVGGTMGGTGYGKAGIETLAMGIPVITNMSKEYADWLPENPFVVANNAKELYEVLVRLIDDRNLREDSGSRGKLWVEKYHGYSGVNNRLYELYKSHGIV